MNKKYLVLPLSAILLSMMLGCHKKEAPPPPPPHTHSVSASGLNLGALRACESGGNYSIVSSNGLYHGAYQFLPSTWDSTARASGMGEWAGTLPSNAPAGVQDAMAINLYNMSGRGQWPVCGARM